MEIIMGTVLDINKTTSINTTENCTDGSCSIKVSKNATVTNTAKNTSVKPDIDEIISDIKDVIFVMAGLVGLYFLQKAHIYLQHKIHNFDHHGNNIPDALDPPIELIGLAAMGIGFDN
jgi:hypothetical protein